MREDTLFIEWRKKYGAAFIPDGIVDEDRFASEDIRFVFVLKEVSECYDDFDLRCFLAQGAPRNGGHTWGPVTRWLGAIAGVTFQVPPDSTTREAWLRRIAAMNLKKTTGGTVAVKTKIVQAARDDADLLREQVRLYLDRPTLFPCCGKGVFELFCDYVLKGIAFGKDTTEDGIEYINIADNGIAFKFCHPNAKQSGRAELFAKTVNSLSEKFSVFAIPTGGMLKHE